MRLARANSRMKDFHDLCTLAARRSFDGELLTKAVRATFQRRNADLTLVPAVLAPEFYDDTALGQRWRAFVKGQPIGTQVEPTFPGVGDQLRRFLGPLASAAAGSLVLITWNHAKGWESRMPG